MSDDGSGEDRESRRFTFQGQNQIELAQAAAQPFLQQIMEQIMGLVSGTQERNAAVRAQSTAAGREAIQGQLAQTLGGIGSKFGAKGRIRGGAAGGALRRARTEAGGQLANVERQGIVGEQRANLQDIIALMQPGLAGTGAQSQFFRDIANLFAGQSAQQANLAAAQAGSGGGELALLGQALGTAASFLVPGAGAVAGAATGALGSIPGAGSMTPAQISGALPGANPLV